MSTEISIKAQGLGKKFSREWIFRNLNLELFQGDKLAVLGANGSGKSTLLQVLSGVMPFSQGELHYYMGNSSLPPDQFFQYFSVCTPYLELIEEFTLEEFLNFHFSFKKIRKGEEIDKLIQLMYLESSRNKQIKFFSSGMRQRVKLAVAFYSSTPVLLLDEPTMNLDRKGVGWFLEQVEKTCGDRLVVVCSNQKHEYEFCEKELLINNYK